MKMRYKIQYVDMETRRVKEVSVEDGEQARRMVQKITRFAINHSLHWVVSLWGDDGWLISSDEINEEA